MSDEGMRKRDGKAIEKINQYDAKTNANVTCSRSTHNNDAVSSEIN
jgi:ribosomal protein S16